MSTVSNIREAKNEMNLVGILSEKNLEVKEGSNGKFISGYLTVQTGEFNFIRVNVYASEKTKQGKDNVSFKGLETVMNDYVSIAEGGRADATEVVVRKGKLAPESYFNSTTGNVTEMMKFSSNFFNRATASDKDEDGNLIPRDDFEVEVYIKSVVPEVYKTGENAGEQTGRAIINAYVPLYGGKVESIQLIAPAEDDIAEVFMDEYKAGDTVMLSGNIVARRVEKTTTIPMKIGKPKVETKVSYVNELLISGASEVYEDEKAFSKEAITTALAERDNRLEQQKNGGNKTTTSTTSVGANKPKPSGRAFGF